MEKRRTIWRAASILCFLGGFVTGFSALASSVTVAGQLVLPDGCQTLKLKDLKLIVTEDSNLGYDRNQVVKIGEDGRYSVALDSYYSYRFRVVMQYANTNPTETDHHYEVFASGRFDPYYPERLPQLNVTCPTPL